jgi:hypothetical protein
MVADAQLMGRDELQIRAAYLGDGGLEGIVGLNGILVQEPEDGVELVSMASR